jgi:hypothetical protein
VTCKKIHGLLDTDGPILCLRHTTCPSKSQDDNSYNGDPRHHVSLLDEWEGCNPRASMIRKRRCGIVKGI